MHHNDHKKEYRRTRGTMLHPAAYTAAGEVGGEGMLQAIITALITGGLSLAGVIVTALITARKNEHALKIAQAVTDTKIEELTREVREHNNFARRMPVVEEQIRTMGRDIQELKGHHKPVRERREMS